MAAGQRVSTRLLPGEIRRSTMGRNPATTKDRPHGRHTSGYPIMDHSYHGNMDHSYHENVDYSYHGNMDHSYHGHMDHIYHGKTDTIP